MYNDEYDNVEDEEVQVSNNFFVNFYNNNKILVWIFGGILIFIILMSLLTKGGKTVGPSIEYSVTMYPEGDVYVNIGRSANLIASVKNNPRAEIVWSVEDENVAKVDNGNVVGLNYGKTTVTATYIDAKNQKHNDTKSIIVADGDPNTTLMDVTFKNGDLFMPTNSTYQIALVLSPTRGYVENESFTSSNTNVATVDNKGLVTSFNEGDATIYVDVNNGQFKRELNIHVSRNYNDSEIIVIPTKISFDGELRKIKIGDSERLSYIITPQNADMDKLEWSSSDESVATVENGVVTGVREGTAIVTVTSVTGVSDKISIEVENDVVEVKSIDLAMSNIEIEIGEMKTIIPEVSPSNASNKALSYMSLDEYVAFVDPNETGTSASVMGISEGTTTIIIESNNGVQKQVNVTVTDPYGMDDEDDWLSYDSYDWGSYELSSVGGGGSGGSKSKGFTITSSDANGKGFIKNSESALKNDGGATSPVKVTVSKKANTDVAKLIVETGGRAPLTITDSDSFTLYAVGEHAITVRQIYSDGTEEVYSRYLKIKEALTTTNSTSCGTKIELKYNEKKTCKINDGSSKIISVKSITPNVAEIETVASDGTYFTVIGKAKTKDFTSINVVYEKGPVDRISVSTVPEEYTINTRSISLAKTETKKVSVVGRKIKEVAIDIGGKSIVKVVSDTNGSWYSIEGLKAGSTKVEIKFNDNTKEILNINVSNNTPPPPLIRCTSARIANIGGSVTCTVENGTIKSSKGVYSIKAIKGSDGGEVSITNQSDKGFKIVGKAIGTATVEVWLVGGTYKFLGITVGTPVTPTPVETKKPRTNCGTVTAKVCSDGNCTVTCNVYNGKISQIIIEPGGSDIARVYYYTSDPTKYYITGRKAGTAIIKIVYDDGSYSRATITVPKVISVPTTTPDNRPCCSSCGGNSQCLSLCKSTC